MHSLPTNNTGYFFNFGLILRESLPKNEKFYILFFLFKFFPILLFTHGNYYQSSNLFTIKKIMKSLTLFNHNITNNYIYLSYFLYFFLGFIIISISVLIIIIKRNEKQNDTVVSIKKSKKKTIDLLIKLINFFLLSSLFVYHYICEILYFGFFKAFFYNLVKKCNLKAITVNSLNTQHYVIGVVNVIYFIFIIMIMYQFFFLVSKQTPINYHGFKTSFSKTQKLIYTLLFSTQGIYSSLSLLKEEKQIETGLYISIIFAIILFINSLVLIKRVNFYSLSKVDIFFKYFSNFCIASTVNDLIVYYFGNEESIQTQKFYLFLLSIDILNGITFTKIMDYIQQKVFLNRLSKECFTFEKLIDQKLLLQFYLFFIKSKKIHEKFLYIIELINQHQKKCNNNEKCLSKKIKQKLISSESPSQIEDLTIKFISYIEFQICENFRRQVKEDKNKISHLLIIHCDYLLSSKRSNLPYLIYICQYYLFNKHAYLTSQDSYLLYELNAVLFNQINKLNEDNPNVSLLEENYQFQKIQKTLEGTLINVEKILQYKAAKYSNSVIYSCENVLECSKNFNQNNKRLINLVSLYDNSNLIQNFLELKYLLLFYTKLFQVVLPKNLLQKLLINPEKDIENELLEAIDNIDISNKFIIISLNKENKFSITHVSLELAEIIGHSIKEIQGKDFHETFLPQHFNPFHEIYMKNFIFFGSSYKKKSFILNKKNQLVPIYVYCKILSTFNSFFSIIIHVNYIKQNNYLQYDALLNETYSFLGMSQSFEKRFSISLKILNSIKLNFFSFFGLNLEKIEEFFKKEKQKINNDKNLFKKKNVSFFPLTTVKKNEIYYYENIDFSTFMKKNYFSNISKSFCIEKDKIMKGIEKLKTLEKDNAFDTYIWKKSNSTHSLRIIDQASDQSKIYTLKQIDHLFALSNFFKVTFQLKSIGNLFYYLATIIETVDDQSLSPIQIKLKANYSSNLYDPLDGRLETDGLFGAENGHNYSKDQTGVEEVGLLGSSTSSLYRIKENSELSFLNNQTNSTYSRVSSLLLNLKPVKTPVAHFFKDKNQETEKRDPKLCSNRLIKIIEFTKVCKISIFTCSFIVVLLNIINVALNNSMLDSSLGLFYINTYSFLLTNDIFYGSVASLGTCFIKDKIQTGDIEDLMFRVNQSSNDLIEHFYLLNFYTNKIITRTESKKIYDILQGEEPYSGLSDNWENIERNSSLVQEIYAFFHYLKLFEINKDYEENNCKIREIYIDKLYEKNKIEGNKNPSPTKEEKLIHYICKNVVSNISIRLEKLMREANILLNSNNESAKWLSVSIIISIFVVSFIAFVVSLVSIWKLTYSISGYIFLLFQKRDKEEIFFDEIILFKKLVNDFSVKDCITFSNFRLRCYLNVSNQKEKTKTIKNKYEDKTKKKYGAIKNMVKISSIKCKGAIQNAETNVQKNKTFRTNFSQKTKPRFSFWGFFTLSLSFTIFTIFEISTIMITINSYDRLIKENNFGTNFLSRGPKINELFLYSIISVLMNDIFYFTTDPALFDSGVFSNNYQITLNLNESSKFSNFKNSNFIYLYYQIYIIRNNINKFISDKKVDNYLKVTLENENHCNSGEDFCFVVTREYLNQYYSAGLSPIIYFKKLNKEASHCSRIGNGINKSGYKTALDVMMQQLVNKYDNFYKSKLSTKQISFLQDDNILIIQNNVVNVLRALHFVDSFSVIKDIKNSYLQNYNKKIFFSVVSIAFTLAIIFIVYLTFLFKFLYYINILQEVINLFDNIVFNGKTVA